jgi:hypothetical protein
MKTQINGKLLFLVLGLLLSILKCDCSKEEFEEVKSLVSHCSPAISGHFDGAIHIASIDTLGDICVKRSFSPGQWSDWSPIDQGFHTKTAPELKAFQSRLHLFARGTDNNLYYLSRFRGNEWGEKIQLTEDGKIRGRISVALSSADFILKAHVVHVESRNSVRYLQINLSNRTIEKSESWEGVIDGTVGTNEINEVAIALRKEHTCQVYLLRNTDGWTPHLVETTNWKFKNTDLSNIVYYPKLAIFPRKTFYYHFTLESIDTDKQDEGGYYSYNINHILVSDDLNDVAFNTLSLPITAHRNRSTEVQTRSVMSKYRDKLLNIRRHTDNNIRYARWDDADPTFPWITSPTVGFEVNTDYRPTAAAFNKRDFFQGQDQIYFSDNYGNDLFVAATGESAILFENFSRTIFQHFTHREFTLYEYDQTGGCPTQSDPNPPVALNALSDNHPYITELGFNQWMFPNWFIEGYYKELGEYFCETIDEWKTMGRTNEPCNSVKLPVIFKPAGGLYVCRGAWVNKSSDNKAIFEELGHYMTHLMSICDVCELPDAFNEQKTGIQQVALERAHALFAEDIGTVPAVPRKIGFTGIGGNYDATSREHSFIYAVYYYLYRAEEMRGYIQADMDAGNTLLRRKYLWIRDNIFRGIEF